MLTSFIQLKPLSTLPRLAESLLSFLWIDCVKKVSASSCRMRTEMKPAATSTLLGVQEQTSPHSRQVKSIPLVISIFMRAEKKV
jgi:hypothetical protein